MDITGPLSDKIRAEIFRAARGKESASREALEAPTQHIRENANRAWALLLNQELLLKEVLDEVVELEAEAALAKRRVVTPTPPTHTKQTTLIIRELTAAVPVEHITRIISVEPKDGDFMHCTDSTVCVTYEVLGHDNKLYGRTKWASDASDSPLWKWWMEWRHAEDENGESYWKRYITSSMARFLIPREEL
jgi:hypothetical protein